MTPQAEGFSRRQLGLLYVAVLLMAFCGLVYELMIGTLSSYLLGDSVLYFSLTIGLFLSAMGLGAWASGQLRHRLLDRFVQVELLLGLLGGLSGLVLFAAHASGLNYHLVAGLYIVVLGAGVGIEIPLLTRIVRPHQGLRVGLAQVLAIDYLGALVASVLFPLVFLPYLGSLRTSLVVGLINLAVGGLLAWQLRGHLQHARRWLAVWALGSLLLGAGLLGAGRLNSLLETQLYQDRIVLAQQTAYQRIVLTRWRADWRLYLDGKLQFSSQDEYRYHEPLVHFPLLAHGRARRMLVLGGGDGLALREVLKYPNVEQVTLVDLDPDLTRLAQSMPEWKKLNANALQSSKLKLVHADAFRFLEQTSETWDVILADLPDPSDTRLGKLYSREMYALVRHALRPGGVFVTQATSPYHAPEVYWCIHHTLEDVFPLVLGCHTQVPSFGGEWGFQLAFVPSRQGSLPDSAGVVQRIAQGLQGRQLGLRHLQAATLSGWFVPHPDWPERPTTPSSLQNQAVVRYHDKSWNRWVE